MTRFVIPLLVGCATKSTIVGEPSDDTGTEVTGDCDEPAGLVHCDGSTAIICDSDGGTASEEDCGSGTMC